MSYQLLDQLTGPLSDILPTTPFLTKTVKYGISADVNIELEANHKHLFDRKGALFTNVLSSFGVLKGELVDDPPNLDGYNSRLLNDYGFIDAKAVSEALKAKGIYRPVDTAFLAPMIANYKNENHTSVLVNLLRFSIILKAKNEKKNFLTKNDELFYDDGHLAVSYRDYLKSEFTEDFDFRFTGEMAVVRFNEDTNFNCDTYCPYVENLSAREFSILCTILRKCECNYPLRIAFSHPQLVREVMLPPGSRLPMYAPNIDNFTAYELDQILMKYVFANRLQANFDLAYLIVVTALFAPLPRAIEANGWLSPVNKISLPKVGSIRGTLSDITEGAPYLTNPQKCLTWENYCKSPNRLYIHGISACESFYAGLFELLTASREGIENTLNTIGITSHTLATPYKVFCEATGFRFGKEFDLIWQTTAGIDCYSHLLTPNPESLDIIATVIDDKLEGYDVYTTKLGGETQVHVITKEVKPAIFPVLSMGVNDDRFYNNALEYTAKLYYDESTDSLGTTESDDINKAMSIFRIGGYDVTMIDLTTNLQFRNWASNANGQVMPIVLPGVKNFGGYRIPVKNINARRRNWMYMPNIIDSITMTAKIRIKGYVIMTNGELISNYMQRYKPITTPPKIIDTEAMILVDMKTSHSAVEYRYKGFQLTAAQKSTSHVRSQLVSSDMIGSRYIGKSTQEDGVDQALETEGSQEM